MVNSCNEDKKQKTKDILNFSIEDFEEFTEDKKQKIGAPRLRTFFNF